MVADQQPMPLAPPAGSAQTASAAAPPDRTARRGPAPERPPGRSSLPASSSPDRSISRHGAVDPRHDHLHRPARAAHAGSPPAGWHGAPPAPAPPRPRSTAVERALQLELQLHRIDVRRLRIVKRMEQQPLLQRRQRQDVLDLRICALQPLDLAPASARPAADRWGVRPPAPGCAACRTSAASAANQRSRQIAHRGLRQQRRRPGPGAPSTVAPSRPSSVSALTSMHAPAASPDRRRHSRTASPAPRPVRAAADAANRPR